jgi:hypothetical protein
MKPRKFASSAIRATAIGLALAVASAHADTTWQWSYSGSGISAAGSLVASDSMDADGFQQILSITGSRNGDPIVALYPTGSAIPDNVPYPVDNLIRLQGPAQLSVKGFGYTLASGAHANPYYGDFLSPPGYAEVFTTGTTLISELPVRFSASPVPEPSTLALALCGLGAVGLWRRARQRFPFTAHDADAAR